MTNLVQYKGYNSNRLHSPALWADCNISGLRQGTQDGIYFFDDMQEFEEAPYVPTNTSVQTTSGGLGKYRAYCAASGSWAQDNMPHSATAGVKDGWISGLCDTAGDLAAIGTTQCPLLLKTTNTGKLWFEGRIATTSILTNMGQIFFGLHENSVTAFTSSIPLGDADVPNTSTASIGFQRAEDGLGVLNTVYNDHTAGPAWTTIQSSASTALAANTGIKLGIKFDPNDSTNCVTFWVNGVKCSTALSKATLLATTYLDVSSLGPCLAFYADSAGTADYIYLDWWSYAQYSE